jgi:hypothetical protein
MKVAFRTSNTTKNFNNNNNNNNKIQKNKSESSGIYKLKSMDYPLQHAGKVVLNNVKRKNTTKNASTYMKHQLETGHMYGNIQNTNSHERQTHEQPRKVPGFLYMPTKQRN